MRNRNIICFGVNLFCSLFAVLTAACQKVLTEYGPQELKEKALLAKNMLLDRFMNLLRKLPEYVATTAKGLDRFGCKAEENVWQCKSDCVHILGVSLSKSQSYTMNDDFVCSCIYIYIYIYHVSYHIILFSPANMAT